MAKTGYGNFDYTYEALWRGAPHQFHVGGNHSGAAFNASDAQSFMEGESSVAALSIAPFQSNPGVSVISSRYYNGVQATPVYERIYGEEYPVPEAIRPTMAAYTTGGGGPVLPLEVCVMVESPAGMSKTGKPVYLRKFLRGAPVGALDVSGSGDAIFTIGAEGAAAATAYGDGSWFGERVYIGPSGTQGTSTSWIALQQPGNHQVPRGRKRKGSVANSRTLLSSIKTLVEDAEYE